MILDTLLRSMTAQMGDGSELGERIKALNPVIKIMRDDTGGFLEMIEASAKEAEAAKEASAPTEEVPPLDKPTG